MRKYWSAVAVAVALAATAGGAQARAAESRAAESRAALSLAAADPAHRGAADRVATGRVATDRVATDRVATDTVETNTVETNTVETNTVETNTVETNTVETNTVVGDRDRGWTERWRWPVIPPRVIRPFEAPATRYSAGHRGIDVATEPGAEIVAPADAVVAFTGTVVDRPVITLAVGDGMLVSMEPVAAHRELVVGRQVMRGESLGEVGLGGHCAARCVHVGVRRDGEYVSPLLYLAAVERAVLLPL